MKTTKTVKTTLTIETTTAELKKNLALYQTDMVAELVASFRKENGDLSFRDASKVAAICFHKGKAFQDLVEKTGAPWLDAPETISGWVTLFREFPCVLGLTDEVVTEDVSKVVLILDGINFDVTEVLHSI